MKPLRLSEEEVFHLATLVKLLLSKKELSMYQDQLSETLSYVKNLGELKTEHVVPTSTTAFLENVYFEDGDENNRGLSVTEAMSGSEKIKDSLFIVHRVL